MSFPEREKTYEPNKLPLSITRTIYVGYGIGEFNAGKIVVHDYEHDSYQFATVRLLAKEITFDLPPAEVDVKGKMLKVLEAEKQKVLAENHQRLKEVQDKIDQLLAIEHKSESGAA